MIKIENIETFGWSGAFRGMRNPKDSWDKSVSDFSDYKNPVLGFNDLKLAISLHKAGPVHSKYKRMIHAQMDVTAPLYWWKEYDTYKVATTANSCSTMHKVHAYPFTKDMFSVEHLTEQNLVVLEHTILALNNARDKYLESKSKNDWWQLIQMLPSTFNQKRTLDLSYETLTNIYRWRRAHKLDEWVEFTNQILENCPYAKELIIPADMDEYNY